MLRITVTVGLCVCSRLSTIENQIYWIVFKPWRIEIIGTWHFILAELIIQEDTSGTFWKIDPTYCSVYNAQCTLYTIYCTMYTVQCVQCTLSIVHTHYVNRCPSSDIIIITISFYSNTMIAQLYYLHCAR